MIFCHKKRIFKQFFSIKLQFMNDDIIMLNEKVKNVSGLQLIYLC